MQIEMYITFNHKNHILILDFLKSLDIEIVDYLSLTNKSLISCVVVFELIKFDKIACGLLAFLLEETVLTYGFMNY